MIEITFVNHAFMSVIADEAITQDLTDFFAFYVPDYQFMPKYREGIWDGKIRLYNPRSTLIYTGLLFYLLKFCKARGYEFSFADMEPFAPQMANITKDDVATFYESLQPAFRGSRIHAKPHQVSGVYHAIKNERTVLISPTSSGKSLMLYALARWHQMHHEGQVLLVVPTTQLVHQMFKDFDEYASMDDSWNAEDNCHKIYAKQEKKTDKPIIISTWQSIYKQKGVF